MAAISQVDDTMTRMADIICADAEWVRAEFEQIVSGLAAVSTATIMPSHGPGVPIYGLIRLTAPSADSWAHAVAERVRAPPPDPAAPGHSH